MTVKKYLQGKSGYLLFGLIVLLLVDSILFRFALNWQDVLIIDLLLLLPLIVYGIGDFLRRYHYYNEVQQRIQEIDRPFLLGELLPAASFIDGQLLNEIIRAMTASLNEQLTQLKAEQNDYYDYVELWVHEIKLPLASLQLMTDNHHLNPYEVKKALAQMDRLIQQSLFYAKSTQVNNDYHISVQSSQAILSDCVARYATDLIGNHFKIVMPENDVQVRTDKQWVAFIVGQLIGNAIKYRRLDGTPQLEIAIITTAEYIDWRIIDFGLGIPAKDLPHLFEKGYTGQNGRQQQQSTGIGLYLCQKLCQQLGIELMIDSIEGEKTVATLRFPIHQVTIL